MREGPVVSSTRRSLQVTHLVSCCKESTFNLPVIEVGTMNRLVQLKTERIIIYP